MILLFAAPPYQPMLINSGLAIPVITDVPGPVFGTALVAHLSSLQWRGGCTNSRLQHSVTATNITKPFSMYIHLKVEEMLSYGNSQKLKIDVVLSRLWNHTRWQRRSKAWASLCNKCVSIWTWLCLCRKKISHMKLMQELQFTLLIINLHSLLLPAGRQVVSLCFHIHSLGGSCYDGIFFFFL